MSLFLNWKTIFGTLAADQGGTNNMGLAVWMCWLLALPLLQSAKILTVCLIGGSHYLLFDEISHNFHLHGHEVRMLLQLGNPLITGLSYASRNGSYQTSTWSLGEDYIKQYNGWFLEQQAQFLLGRDSFNGFLNFMGHLSYQCDKLLGDSDQISFLQSEQYDIAVLDAFNPCSFIIAHKLGVPYIAFYPGPLNGPLSIASPSSVSSVPAFSSQLSDRMDLLGRAKNFIYSLLGAVGQQIVWSIFKDVAERHLNSGSPPGSLDEFLQKAELWVFNTDFSLEFPQPLLPCTVLIGGLLNKPPEPLDQDLDLWISSFGESGFIVVTMGSMVSTVSVDRLLVELVDGFSVIPQGVIWRYNRERWPAHLSKPSNVLLVDWLPLNDLLGHEKARLFITHGGQNSLLQAVYHAVPVLGIPLFGDQFDNVVRAEAKGLGLAISPTRITGELLSATIQTVVRDGRFKAAALSLSRIHRSQPTPPAIRLLQWVEHILQSGGGAHLRPTSLQQPWYQRYLLDLLLLVLTGLAGSVLLCWIFCKAKTGKSDIKKLQ
ncbi:UDP-glucuronosyltransferase 3A1-like isoform X1 [Syngnathoides biaculeatus]|uniref:UDP-glucuronosyltransferase 3A1-like isoform X1 n=2 Tax=Syngnathoides biaculeatus TaxID=300417 RepID=UPI002ADE23F2|nr:UDP-glucuronosyltransferase 3A1-like isoform X1 [Syngnathoides biaculeatus]XP_061673986.1 UDP-glucuronosyltransferase 3A1-like isoform X1 [Syngnathoides biaculeatus]